MRPSDIFKDDWLCVVIFAIVVLLAVYVLHELMQDKIPLYPQTEEVEDGSD